MKRPSRLWVPDRLVDHYESPRPVLEGGDRVRSGRSLPNQPEKVSSISCWASLRLAADTGPVCPEVGGGEGLAIGRLDRAQLDGVDVGGGVMRPVSDKVMRSEGMLVPFMLMDVGRCVTRNGTSLGPT